MSPLFGVHRFENSDVAAGATNVTPLGLHKIPQYILDLFRSIGEGIGNTYSSHSHWLPIACTILASASLNFYWTMSLHMMRKSNEKRGREGYLVLKIGGWATRLKSCPKITQDDPFPSLINHPLEELFHVLHPLTTLSHGNSNMLPFFLADTIHYYEKRYMFTLLFKEIKNNYLI